MSEIGRIYTPVVTVYLLSPLISASVATTKKSSALSSSSGEVDLTMTTPTLKLSSGENVPYVYPMHDKPRQIFHTDPQ